MPGTNSAKPSTSNTGHSHRQTGGNKKAGEQEKGKIGAFFVPMHKTQMMERTPPEDKPAKKIRTEEEMPVEEAQIGKEEGIMDKLERIIMIMNNNNQDLKEEIHFLKEELKKDREEREAEKNRWMEEVNYLKNELKNVKNQIQRLEKKEREKNIVIKGLKETENEEKTGEIVEEMLKKDLNLSDIRIRKVERIGAKISGRTRPIIIALENKEDKLTILKCKKKLKGTTIYLDDDLTREERERKKKLLRIVWEERKKNKNAYLRGDRIVVEGEMFMLIEGDGKEEDQLKKIERGRRMESKND